jgi:hypothetical protein
MAFAQRLTLTSVRNLTSILSKTQAVLKPRLEVVAAYEQAIRPHTSTGNFMAFGMPKQARQKAADLQRLQQAMLAHFNKSLPPEAGLITGSLLPAEAFQNDIGRFLMLACDFYAASPENTYVTTHSPEAAKRLGLIFVPAQMPDSLKSQALSKLQWLREAVASDHRRTAMALHQGDISKLLESNDRKTAYRQELETIVQGLAVARCGATAWQVHEDHFRATLQSL